MEKRKENGATVEYVAIGNVCRAAIYARSKKRFEDPNETCKELKVKSDRFPLLSPEDVAKALQVAKRDKDAKEGSPIQIDGITYFFEQETAGEVTLLKSEDGKGLAVAACRQAFVMALTDDKQPQSDREPQSLTTAGQQVENYLKKLKQSEHDATYT